MTAKGMRKRWILEPLPPFPLPLPLPRFRFHKNVVISLAAIPPTNAEAADSADRFRFRIPAYMVTHTHVVTYTNVVRYTWVNCEIDRFLG